MKPGYLYVLVHPSDPNLYKIGVTVLEPRARLAQHNRQHATYAGSIVKKTGQDWQIKTSISVADTYWAEKAFWAATSIQDLPYRNGVEVVQMTWGEVLCGLEAARDAGTRPTNEKPKRDRDWMAQQLDGTGMRMLSPYRGLVTSVLFECIKGHVFKESPGLLVNYRSCPCCTDWNCRSGWRRGLRESLG
jgi:hypothetical protein